MRILFCTGGMALPHMMGGSQRTSDTLISELTRLGHCVALSAALGGTGWITTVARVKLKLWRKGYAVDQYLGYPTYRSWFPEQTLDAVIDDFRPDICIALAHKQAVIADHIRRRSVPLVLALQDVEFEENFEMLQNLGPVVSVANSHFTAEKYRRAFGLDPKIIHPMIKIEDYLTEPDGDIILFINPTAQKGVDLAIETAKAMPTEQFVFLESWPLSHDLRQALISRISGIPNIALRSPSDDMRSHYRGAKLLLAPSQWEEGYGRIATEAQVSGIPVVGSNRGGLPEAIGPGGEILPHDAPVPQWVDAIRKVLADDAYPGYRIKAKAHARRDALRLHLQARAWEQSITTALAAAGQ